MTSKSGSRKTGMWQSKGGRLVVVTIAALLGAPAVLAAEEEGVRTGVVQEVDRQTGLVVIDDARYRLEGKRVQPPPSVGAESEDYRTRPFRAGMIVRFTLQPGNPPAILEAWAVDR